MPAHGDMFDEGLFPLDELERDPSVFLRDRYMAPPFSVLDRRSGSWFARDRAWKSMGIKSEVGRDDDLAFRTGDSAWKKGLQSELGRKPDLMFHSMADVDYVHDSQKAFNTTSIYSPTLCELLVRWYSGPGDMVFDPFAGGSVRGVVTTTLERHYTGIELRPEQVEANRAQQELGGGQVPVWIEGDSADMNELLPKGFRSDFILSCPPYAYLEKYSDDPRDISSLPYPDFLDQYRTIIRRAVRTLHDDRFIAWSISDVRDREDPNGSYVGLLRDTQLAFRDAGAQLYNEHVVLTPVGTAALRAPTHFDNTRKIGRIHETVYVFIKGNAKAATARMGKVS